MKFKDEELIRLLEKNKKDVVATLENLVEIAGRMPRNGRYSIGRRGVNRRKNVFEYPDKLTSKSLKKIISDEKKRLLAKYKEEGACKDFGSNTYRRLMDLLSYYDLNGEEKKTFKKMLKDFKIWTNKYKTKSKKFSPVKK